MVIEVNKDIDRYQESVAMGLTARQLIFSIASVVVGGGIVLLLYKYIGLTGSAYVAIPCVAPIALGGFYSFNGMNFYEYMGKKLHFMFGNRALTYVSTEGEPAIKQLEAEQNEQVKKKGRKAEPETVTADSAVKKQEEFEAMKKKTRNMLLGLVAVIVVAVLSRISLSSRESVIRITIFLRKFHMPRERRKRRLRKSWMMSVRMTSAFSLWE